MDRVDRWLSAQRGWRRLLIAWLILEPALINAGLLWSGWGNIDDQGTVPTGSVLWHVPYRALFLADAAACGLLVWNARYYRRLRRQAEADARTTAS
jgi:hypothetical protein